MAVLSCTSAGVTASAVGGEGATVLKALEPMAIAGKRSYGNYFRMPGNGPYRIEMQIRRPGSPVETRAIFDWGRSWFRNSNWNRAVQAAGMQGVRLAAFFQVLQSWPRKRPPGLCSVSPVMTNKSGFPYVFPGVRRQIQVAASGKLINVIRNRVIPPLEITSILPPCASTMDLTMASPRPVPPSCRDGSTR